MNLLLKLLLLEETMMHYKKEAIQEAETETAADDDGTRGTR